MRYMESVTFTCTMSAEEIEKTLRARNLTYTLMTWMCPLSVLLFVGTVCNAFIEAHCATASVVYLTALGF